MAGLGISAYIDVPAYQRAPHGQEIASLLGLNTVTAGVPQSAGATSLQVESSTGWAAGPAWILDGPCSEVVAVTGSADGTHLTLAAPGTQFDHMAGASVSQAGPNGSLAEVILRASAWIENYCQQGAAGSDRSLFAIARTERWAMPTVRAYVNRDGVVTVMPGHFPVQSVSSLSVEFGQGQSCSLDVSQLENQATARLIEAPFSLASGISVGQQMSVTTGGISRSSRQWANVTYTGGIPANAVPWDVRQACVWIVSDFLAQRQNPTGAAEISLGKRRVVQRQRGDLVGDSILLLRAHDALDLYRAEAWA